MKPTQQGRIIIVQPALPTYRVDFFQHLADKLGNRFVVHASSGNLGALTAKRPLFPWERRLPEIKSIAPGLSWQPGACSIDLTHNDVVVISGAPRCLSNLALLAQARRRGAKTIWWGHFRSATTKKWRLKLRMLVRKFTDGLLFYTEAEVARYQAFFPPLPSSHRPLVGALNNGINSIPIQQLRKPYKAENRPLAFMFLGRLTEKAELHLALMALAQHKEKNTSLHVVGSGPQEAHLQEIARKLDLSDRVIWHGPLTEEALIANVANQCRAFLYPGSVGLSLIHTMNYGLPALVHNNPHTHMPEIAAFEKNSTGCSFIKDDIEDLSKQMTRMMDEEHLLNHMSAKAIATVARSFNTKDMAHRLIALVEKLQKMS